NFRMLPHYLWLNIRNVAGRVKSSFDILSSLNPRVAESLRRKLHEPIVVHVNRSGNVLLPTLRLIEINPHGILNLFSFAHGWQGKLVDYFLIAEQLNRHPNGPKTTLPKTYRCALPPLLAISRC